ncbi:MAG: hypothetical protein C0177_02155 [Fervidicoccus fontis]|nr:MAG: hypothetical protein C0177_02155 [Fervidicoccus fontis]
MLKSCEDHDILIEKDMGIAQVIGYYHPPGSCYAFKKYTMAKNRNLWKKGEISYKRLFRLYSPKILRKGQNLTYDPSLRSIFPIISESEISSHLKPEEGMKRLLRASKDELECTALELYDSLRELGISSNSIGITGSILAGIHNPKISDLDITVRGCKDIFILKEQSPLTPLKESQLKSWIKNNSLRLSLPPELVRQLYSPMRRGTYKNYLASIIPIVSSEEAGRYQLVEGAYIGTATLVLELEEPSCHSFIYPSLSEFKVKRRIDGPTDISEGMIGSILSYESLFSNLLSSSSKVIIRGKVYLKRDENTLKIITGVRELKSYVRKLE